MTAQKPLVTDAGTTQQLQAGNQIEINAGTAALPALTIDGDPNTGLFSPGADQLAVSTAGTQRMVVDASGNVGIGKVPSFEFFAVQRNADSETFSGFSNATNGASARAAVGVGAAGSEVNLYALSASYTAIGSIAQDLPAASVAGVFFPGVGGTNAANVIGSLSTGKPVDIIPNMGSSQRVFRVDTSGRVIVGGTGTSTTTARFDVRDGSSVPGATVFAVTDAGNVGVGTLTPSADLTVEKSATTVSSLVKNTSSGAAAQSQVRVAGNTAGVEAFLAAYGSANGNTVFGPISLNDSVAWYAQTAAQNMFIATLGTTAPIHIGTAANTNGNRALEIGANGGSVTVNPDGAAAIDFVVESDTNANMLVVDASANAVGVGTGSPVAGFFDAASYFRVKNTADNASAYQFCDAAGNIVVRVDTVSSQVGINTPGIATATLDVRGTVLAKNTSDSLTAFQVQNQAGTTVLDVDTTNQRVGIGTTTPNARLTIDGGTSTAEELLLAKTSANGNAVVTVRNDTSGSAAQASLYLQTDPGAGRYSSFAVTSNGWTPNGLSLPNQYQSHPDTGLTNGMLFATEAANAPIVFAVPTVNGNGFATTSERLRVNGSEVVVNDGVQNVDFRVESQSNTHMLFVDASANAVGVGTPTPTSTAQIAGSLALAITSTSVGITLDATHYTVLCNTSGGGFTITLPAASTCSGRVYVVKNISSTNTATVQGNGLETIDGSNTYALSSQWQSVTIQSDGSAWYRIA